MFTHVVGGKKENVIKNVIKKLEEDILSEIEHENVSDKNIFFFYSYYFYGFV